MSKKKQRSRECNEQEEASKQANGRFEEEEEDNVIINRKT